MRPKITLPVLSAYTALMFSACAIGGPANPPSPTEASSPTPKQSASVYEQGKRDAGKAIAEGKPVMETYGLRSAGPDFYSQALGRRGVTLKVVAGCVIDDTIADHAKGVNETTEAWLKKKYGDGVMEKIGKEYEADQEKYRLELEAVKQRGMDDATKAIKAGHPFIERWATDDSREPEFYAEAMAKRGVKTVFIRHYDDFSTASRRSEGVAEVTEAWLKKRYGEDVMAKIDDEVKRRVLGSAKPATK